MTQMYFTFLTILIIEKQTPVKKVYVTQKII